MNYKEFLESDFTITYGGEEIATIKGKDFQSRWNVEITVNGGLEYKAMLTDDEIKNLLGMAAEMERNTAYDPI